MRSQLLFSSDASGRHSTLFPVVWILYYWILFYYCFFFFMHRRFFYFILFLNFYPAKLLPAPAGPRSAQHQLLLLNLITMFLVLSATTELRDFFAKARNGSVRLIKVVIEDGKSWF